MQSKYQSHGHVVTKKFCPTDFDEHALRLLGDQHLHLLAQHHVTWSCLVYASVIPTRLVYAFGEIARTARQTAKQRDRQSDRQIDISVTRTFSTPATQLVPNSMNHVLRSMCDAQSHTWIWQSNSTECSMTLTHATQKPQWCKKTTHPCTGTLAHALGTLTRSDPRRPHRHAPSQPPRAV